MHATAVALFLDNGKLSPVTIDSSTVESRQSRCRQSEFFRGANQQYVINVNLVNADHDFFIAMHDG